MKNSGNIIDRLHEDEMLYFILGTLISADNLVDHQACVESMTCLQRLRDDFLISSLKDDQHLRKMLDDAEQIIIVPQHIRKKPDEGSVRCDL